VDVTLHSVFASRKRNAEDEKTAQPVMAPSHFQVYTKIDEESRKDNKLVISFLLTLNDTKGQVTYEFRGIGTITGTAADFESIMETSKNSRVPKILDVLYQKLYPAMFMLAGMTSSSFPQSVALLIDMVSNEPIPVKQEFAPATPSSAEKSESSASGTPKPVPKAPMSRPIPVKSSTAPKPMPTEQKPIGAKPKVEIGRPAA
jgi:hypothetical protein